LCPPAVGIASQAHVSSRAATVLKRNPRRIQPFCSLKIPFIANVSEVLNAAAQYPGQIIKKILTELK
jgi:hypothetical protein